MVRDSGDCYCLTVDQALVLSNSKPSLNSPGLKSEDVLVVAHCRLVLELGRARRCAARLTGRPCARGRDRRRSPQAGVLAVWERLRSWGSFSVRRKGLELRELQDDGSLLPEEQPHFMNRGDGGCELTAPIEDLGDPGGVVA